MKYLLAIFALFELLVGVRFITATPEAMNQRLQLLEMNTYSMHYVIGFGAALVTIAIIAFVGIFIKDRLSLLAMSAGFSVYNALSTYNSFFDAAPEFYVTAGYIHGLFTLLFLGALIYLIRSNRESSINEYSNHAETGN